MFRHVDTERIEWLLRHGLTIREVAEQVGCSNRAVIRQRRRIGLSKPARPALTQAELVTAKRLLDDGASYTEAAGLSAAQMLAGKFPGYAWTPVQVGQWARASERIQGSDGMSAARRTLSDLW